MKNSFSRKQFYDLVWSKPLIQLAKQYSISDNGLREICKKHNIPLPKLGHWQKLQYGKKVTIIPFPKEKDEEIKIYLTERKKGEVVVDHYLSEYYRLKKAIENDKSLTLKVPNELTNPNRLIVQARRDLKNPSTRKSYYYKGVITTSENIISISVSKGNVRRALLFMDALIKLLNKRGHKVIVKDNMTYAVVQNEEMRLRFREKLKRVEIDNGRWKSTELHANGILQLKLEGIGFSDKEWSDTKKERLEEQLSKILAKLEITGDDLKKQRIKREEWNRQYRIERERKENLKKRKEEELANFKDFLNSAARFEKVSQLSNYVEAVINKAAQSCGLTAGQKTWIKWANEKIEWYDPLMEKDDELLDDVDKEDLAFKNKSYW